tara:strand:+ start:934 stop:1638 length:705 start_codon:yes stop_codon:yes gene_type:complete
MADLVIKPTSGNLIIKDDQNVARATIATSSGATTLSNVNVTGGSVGSSVIMPAGAVVNVTKFDIGQHYWSMAGADSGYKNVTTNTGTTTNWAALTAFPHWQVTLKQANSKILIQVYMTAGGWSSHGYFDMKRGRGVESPTSAQGTGSHEPNADHYQWLGGPDGMYAEHRETGEYSFMGTMGWLDDPGTSEAGTILTYVAYVAQHSSTETFAINRYYNNSNQDTSSQAIFTEIAV